MHPIPQQPSRRHVLRAAAASLAALAITAATSSQAIATAVTEAPQGRPDGGPHLPGPPDHRAIVGLL